MPQRLGLTTAWRKGNTCSISSNRYCNSDSQHLGRRKPEMLKRVGARGTGNPRASDLTSADTVSYLLCIVPQPVLCGRVAYHLYRKWVRARLCLCVSESIWVLLWAWVFCLLFLCFHVCAGLTRLCKEGFAVNSISSTGAPEQDPRETASCGGRSTTASLCSFSTSGDGFA